MDNLSKIRILKGLFSFMAVVASYVSWWSIKEAVHNPNASDLVAPAVFISLTLILLGILFVIVKEKKNLIGLVVVVMLQSVWFAPNVWHMGLLTISVILTMGGIFKIQSELRERLHLHIMYSLRRGFTPITLSFMLILCSVYFWQISALQAESLIPKVQLGQRTQNMIYTMLGNINPQFKSLQQEDLTVDEFLKNITDEQVVRQIGTVQSEKVDSIIQEQGLEEEQREEVERVLNENLNAAIEAEKENTLKAGREQLSELAGVPLVGAENVTDVFTLILNNKIRDVTYDQIQAEGNKTILPLIITSLLFITIMPIVTVVKYIWFFLAGSIVRLFIYFNWIRIHKISKLTEVME